MFFSRKRDTDRLWERVHEALDSIESASSKFEHYKDNAQFQMKLLELGVHTLEEIVEALEGEQEELFRMGGLNHPSSYRRMKCR